MKFLSNVLASGLLVLMCSEAHAQNIARTNELNLINGSGQLTLTYDGTTDRTFTFPDGTSTAVLTGSTNGQTLSWNNGNWVPRSNLLNDGTDVTIDGNLTVTTGSFTGSGAGLTYLNATNITDGTLDLARISTAGALPSQVLMYDGAGLIFGDGGSFSLPAADTLANVDPLLRLSNTDGGVIEGRAVDSITAAFYSETNTAVQGISVDGFGVHGISNVTGVRGEANVGSGGHFTSNSGDGVRAISGSATGVNARSTTSRALWARSESGGAAEMTSTSGPYGVKSTAPVGIAGDFITTTGYAIQASGASGVGAYITGDDTTLYAASTNGGAILSSSNGTALSVSNTNGTAISTTNIFGIGVEGTSQYGYGGSFTSEFATSIYATAGNSNAALFENTNASNSNATVAVSTVGNGTAIRASGILNAIDASSDDGSAVSGSTLTGSGVYGTSSSGIGIHGESTDGTAGYFSSVNGGGISASSAASGTGGYFSSQTGTAVMAMSQGGSGGYFLSTNSSGLSAHSNSSYGAFISSSGSSPALYATNNTAYAGMFSSTSGRGIYASSATGDAGEFASTNARAIFATSIDSSGGEFISSLGYGLIATSYNETAARFVGSRGIEVVGTSDDAAEFTSTNGRAIYAHSQQAAGGVLQSTYGFGLEAISAEASGLRSTSTNGYGGEFLSTNNASLYAESTTNYGIQAVTNAIGSFGGYFIGLTNQSGGVKINAGVGGIGLQVDRGRLIASNASIANGSVVPDDVMIVNAEDNGSVSPTQITLPYNAVNGQVLMVTTTDADGVEINGILRPVNHVTQWVYMQGVWMAGS